MIKKTVFTACLLLCAMSSFAFDGLTSADGSHWDITSKALDDNYGHHRGTVLSIKTMPVFGIESYQYENPTASDILVQASGGPDLYDFGVLAPHSQTVDYDYKTEFSNTELMELEKNALVDYLFYCSGLLNRMEQEWATGKVREASYLTGYFMHTFEDLFAHKGMTNSQHKWLEAQDNNPDYDGQSILEAEHAVERFLKALPENMSPEASSIFLDTVSSDKEVQPLSKKEVSKILGKNRDIYIEGIKYVLFTKGDENSMKYFDRISWDYQTLTDIFCLKDYFRQLLQVKTNEQAADLLKEAGYNY